MKIAYLISAHTDVEQLKRLISALHEDAHYFIHIDKKSPLEDFTRRISGDNVHFLTERIDVRWGTWTEVIYQMLLLKAAVDSNVRFDRYFTLSGMDYPVWSNERITCYLEDIRDKELLQGICMDSDAIAERQQERYQRRRPFFNYSFLSNKWNMRLSEICKDFLGLLGRRNQLFYYDEQGQLVQLYKGSSWWCITDDLARFVLEEYENNTKLKDFLINSISQADSFVQTIAFNSKQFKDKCILKKGEFPNLSQLNPLHYINYNQKVQILTEADYDNILASDKMFCRKIVSGQSDSLVEKLKSHKSTTL